jgi:hypothetical protein
MEEPPCNEDAENLHRVQDTGNGLPDTSNTLSKKGIQNPEVRDLKKTIQEAILDQGLWYSY